jgi:HK97 family phage prohead protease
MSNDTLKLSFDDWGLKVVADLSSTEASRSMYEDIKAGLVTKMSWGFIPNGSPEFDEETSTLTWKCGIKKIYDVSAVSIPANDTTEISARSLCDGVIEKAHEERMKAEARELERKRLIALLELEEIK